MAARAQQAGMVPRVGVLYPGPKAAAAPRVEAILKGLREAGYAAPAQIEVVLRTGDGDPSRIAPLVAEIVKSRVDVIFAIGPEVLQEFRSATTAIPIVTLDLESDPVARGLVTTLAHPGGNITGVFFDFPSFTTKWLELLKEINPRLSRISVLWDSATGPTQLKAIQEAAGPLAIQADISEVRTRSEFDQAFASANRQGVGAVLMLSSPLIGANGQLLADLAIQHHLPAITLFPDFARAGGLLAYGPNLLDMFRQAGNMTGKVLKGAKPAELPVERPTNFQLVLNLKTAMSLGVSIPTSVLLRADEVIE
jgi:putative ABC transport system substrate-binding protein